MKIKGGLFYLMFCHLVFYEMNALSMNCCEWKIALQSWAAPLTPSTGNNTRTCKLRLFVLDIQWTFMWFLCLSFCPELLWPYLREAWWLVHSCGRDHCAACWSLCLEYLPCLFSSCPEKKSAILSGEIKLVEGEGWAFSSTFCALHTYVD